jgi:hypothetical protein
MLRWTVALLIAANLAFFAWTRGWLTPVVGLSPQGDRDPQRLQQQVHPERVEVLAPDAASAAIAGSAAAAASSAEPSGPAATPPGAPGAMNATGQALACLEAGPYGPDDLRVVQTALTQAGLAAERAQSIAAPSPSQWLVYMGRFADEATLQRKEDELRRIHVGFQEIHGASSLEPGLSLGRFGDRPAAEDALARVSQHGVHTARVVQLPPSAPLHLLRMQHVEPALAARLQALQWPVAGPGLRACPAVTADAADAASVGPAAVALRVDGSTMREGESASTSLRAPDGKASGPARNS